ncbi:hypothetical protein RM6536_0501 [Rothia mucilaginosa]|uniref:Uncharacterized protein n=1 Tax=Rothia mucilaginosa TaxID=43675 RepID=A0A0K2RY37_9MICC|nr:hypothetical protein RM6536_0501 [Rothia mucilaginosa]
MVDLYSGMPGVRLHASTATWKLPELLRCPLPRYFRWSSQLYWSSQCSLKTQKRPARITFGCARGVFIRHGLLRSGSVTGRC